MMFFFSRESKRWCFLGRSLTLDKLPTGYWFQHPRQHTKLELEMGEKQPLNQVFFSEIDHRKCLQPQAHHHKAFGAKKAHSRSWFWNHWHGKIILIMNVYYYLYCLMENHSQFVFIRLVFTFCCCFAFLVCKQCKKSKHFLIYIVPYYFLFN